MKTPLFLFPFLLFLQISGYGQLTHANRSYQVNVNYGFTTKGGENYNTFLIQLNQGVHAKRGFSFLYDLSLERTKVSSEIELTTDYRYSYFRRKKIEAYLGMELGARYFMGDKFLWKQVKEPVEWRFFIGPKAGYQFFLNSNTALEWDISYPVLVGNKKDKWSDPINYEVGTVNSTLKLRYFLGRKNKEEISTENYQLKKDTWMIVVPLNLAHSMSLIEILNTQ